MISNNIRLLVVIISSVSLAIMVLGSTDLNVGVGDARFQRAGTGPLGLKLGLDLQGGVHLIYQADIENPTKSQMDGVLNIIERRVNAFGVAEPSLQIMGNNRLLIQLPGVDNIEEAKRLIGRTAQLEFKERNCLDPSCSQFEDQDIGLTGDLLDEAYWSRQSTTGEPIVNLKFNSKGADIFADITTRIAGTGDKIAIFLDEEELLSPVAQNPIFGGEAIIEGNFTTERVRTISIQLESGRLPVPISVIEEHDVDATLGTNALRKSLQAGYIGFALVVIFMIIYYRIPGFIATLALLSYVALVLAIFKLIPITLTLAGIAGFILSVGMAVDANILIFERMKEELRTGRSLLASIDMGFNRAWPSIRDSNVSTFITCLILFWFGSRLGMSLVTGFAVSLFIGVAVSMFSAIIISKTLLRISGASPAGKSPNLFSPVPGSLAKEVTSQPRSRT